MKKLLALFLAFSVCFCLPVGSSATKEPQSYDRQPGDVSGDGEVNAKDAQLVLKFTVGKWELDDLSRNAALVSAETGDPTAEDALLILRYTVRRIQWFPRYSETPAISGVQVGAAQTLAAEPFSYTMLITTYEQYTRAVEQGLVSAGRSEEFFSRQDLLIFDYIPRQMTATLTVESVVRVNGDLQIAFHSKEEGDNNSRSLALPCCVSMEKLKQTPDYFVFQVSRQIATVVNPTTESHRIPNVESGTVMVFDQPELSAENTPPAEVEAYAMYAARTYQQKMVEMLGRDCKEALLGNGAFTRYTPVMVTAAFGNLGCDVEITGWQREKNRFSLDVTVHHRPGGEVEDSKLLVLWLDNETMGTQPDCWLWVTRRFGQGEETTESRYCKPFHTDAKTTAMNQVSYQVIPVSDGLVDGQETPAVQAAYCDTYEDYVTAMDTRILAETVTHREPFYALASKGDFERSDLVVIAYRTDRAGYELLPDGLGISSLWGSQLYGFMTLKGENLSEGSQQFLCFVWLDSLSVYDSLELVTTYRQGDSTKNVTQTLVF